MSKFTDAVVLNCKAELKYFQGGKLKETDGAVYKRVGEYWLAIPVKGIDGRTQVKDKKGKPYNPPWSSAFIAFIMRASGAGDSFRYAQAHCHYIEAARVDGAKNDKAAAYFAVDPYSITPDVGDIICAGREYAKTLTFKQSELAYKADGHYPSHGDVVVEVDRVKGLVKAIGGNVDNSVLEKSLTLSKSGRLEDRLDGPTKLPWLALLRCQK